MANAIRKQPNCQQSVVDAIAALVIVALLIATATWAMWSKVKRGPPFPLLLVAASMCLLASPGLFIAYFVYDISPCITCFKGLAVLSLCAFQLPPLESGFRMAHWLLWATLTAAFGGIGLWQLVDSGLEILWAIPIVGPFCLVALTLSLLAQRVIIRRTAKIQTSTTTQPPSLFSPSDLLSLASDVFALLGSAACLAITISTNMSLAGPNCAIAGLHMLWKLFNHRQAEIGQEQRAGQPGGISIGSESCHSETSLVHHESDYHNTPRQMASAGNMPREVPQPAVPSPVILGQRNWGRSLQTGMS